MNHYEYEENALHEEVAEENITQDEFDICMAELYSEAKEEAERGSEEAKDYLYGCC